MKKIIITEAFHNHLGHWIEEGKFNFLDLTKNHKGEDCRLYKRVAYSQTIKLNQEDMQREEVKEIK